MDAAQQQALKPVMRSCFCLALFEMRLFVQSCQHVRKKTESCTGGIFRTMPVVYRVHCEANTFCHSPWQCGWTLVASILHFQICCLFKCRDVTELCKNTETLKYYEINAAANRASLDPAVELRESFAWEIFPSKYWHSISKLFIAGCVTLFSVGVTLVDTAPKAYVAESSTLNSTQISITTLSK